jgi:uncharacterized membrane protein YkoI
MDTNMNTTKPRRAKLAALVAGGLLLGGAAAGVIGASAATAESASPSTSTSSSAAASDTAEHGPGSGRSDETVVTGTKAATLKAAALKAVPGGTVDRVETDAGDGAYEAHVTKADGTRVTVKFDSSLKVTAVEDGMGKGDPAPSGSQSQSGSSSTEG